MLNVNNDKQGILRIGTSNIVLPGNKQSFPVEFRDKSRLHYYSSLFNTLEVNSTFYKLPMGSTLEKWSGDVPKNFQFSLKVWKQITHAKELHLKRDDVETFLKIVNHLEEKNGCLLLQFPASITFHYYKKVEDILLKIKECEKGKIWRKALEFRSDTWYKSETKALLKKFDAVMVLHDMPKSKILTPVASDAFYYFRFHGEKGDYRGSYSSDFLKKQGIKIKALLNKGKDVYAYFNNTIGAAFENAVALREIIEGV